jgi:hypothetical protein
MWMLFGRRLLRLVLGVDMQLDDMFWGERHGQLTDPFGYAWSLSMRIQMSPKEMERKRQEAMKMFEQGHHPEQDGSSRTT